MSFTKIRKAQYRLLKTKSFLEIIRKNGLLLATANKGKKQELESLLEANGAQVFFPADRGLVFSVEETEDTFQGNALLKARALAGAGPVLADDSGLCVRALDDRPGVLSARYGGHKSDKERCLKLLAELKGVTDRRASFHCCLAFLCSGQEFLFNGRVDGLILEEMHGQRGFGYDPIFYYPPLQKSFAELLPSEKNQVSHRSRALQDFLGFLKSG